MLLSFSDLICTVFFAIKHGRKMNTELILQGLGAFECCDSNECKKIILVNFHGDKILLIC